MIKISAWNIHGLTEWKHDHPDLLNLLNSNDITCIVESWFSETQCELMKNKLIDKFSILYTCRKKNNRAKRNSGGIIVFIKKRLNKHVSIVQQLDEDILWLRLSKLVTNYEQDLYLCCTYLSPRSSTRYMGDAKRKLELLYEDVVKYRAIGHVMIIGDLNSRTSNLNDFIDINERCDELCTPGECERIMTIDDIVSLNSNVKRERISDDTNVNESGKELLNICMLNELFIFNGRIGASPECSYTCNTPLGSSVVDYIIGDGCILSYADTFHVNEASPLSDHSSITVHMNCLSRSNSDAKLDDRKTSVRYIWNNNNAEMYRNNICRDEVVLALNDIADQVHDTDSVNVINEITQQLQDVILTSAEHCRKSTVANKNKIVKPQRS